MFWYLKNIKRLVIVSNLLLMILFLFPRGLYATEAKMIFRPQGFAGKVWDPIDALGITGMECKCSYTHTGDAAGEHFWVFQSEPVIKGVDPDGPAAGKLEPDDVIVAIDRMLITTRKAGVRFAHIKAGELVELTIRRGNLRISHWILAEPVPSGKEVLVEGIDTSYARRGDKLSEAIEALAKYATDLSKAIEKHAVLEALELPPVPEILEKGKPWVPELPDIADYLDITPLGWFGFRLSFAGSIENKSPKPAQWRFKSPPKIHTIEPGSPADRAGLEKGDVLTHIDGIKLDSRKGGKHFSSVEPGQAVRWTIRRNGVKRDISMVAEERPEGVRAPSWEKPKPPRFPLVDEPRELLYSGSLGETGVKVTGTRSVRVTVDKERGEIIIETPDATVRLQLSGKEE